MARKFDRNAFMLSIVFIIFCLPIVLSVTRIGQEETRQFSIYNTNWDGVSEFKTTLENEGYEFQPIVSTLNTLTRLDTVGVLALIGPTIFFDPTETAALAYFLMRGGSVLIADDFGSGNNILDLINAVIAPFVDSINVSGFGEVGLPFQGVKFNNSLLCDYGSYHISPVMPKIRNFVSGTGLPSMDGVNEVITSYPSAISFLTYNETLGSTSWTPRLFSLDIDIPSGIMSTTSNSWLETDVEAAKVGEFNRDENEWRGTEFTVMFPLPLGSVGLGNLLLCSDPSIFINELMLMSQFDNARLASNIFNWLDINGTRTIYYDESHLSSAQGRAILSVFDPFSYVSMYLRYVDSFTMFPLLAPFFPIITFIFLKRNYPKSKGPSPLLMTKIQQQRSRSFFAAKLAWYINYAQYDKALDVLYKRLKRRVVKKFGDDAADNSASIMEVLSEQYPDEINYVETNRSLKKIENIIQKPKKVSEEDFLELVLEIKYIEDIITKPRM